MAAARLSGSDFVWLIDSPCHRARLKRPRALIFDEATSNLDAPTAERFAQTVNQLKGKATILFIAHQLPKGLARFSPGALS